MHIHIPEAYSNEAKYLSQANSKPLGPVKGANWGAVVEGEGFTQSYFEVVALRRAHLNAVAPLVEFRYLTSLIAIVVIVEYFRKTEDWLALMAIQGEVDVPIKYENHGVADALLYVAAGGLSTEALIISSKLTEFVVSHPEKFKTFKEVIGDLVKLNQEFEWGLVSSTLEVPGSFDFVAALFEEGLEWVENQGIEFNFKEECLHILSHLREGVILLKLDSSGTFEMP